MNTKNATMTINATISVNGPTKSMLSPRRRCELSALDEDLGAHHAVHADRRIGRDEVAFGLHLVALAVDVRKAGRPQLRKRDAFAAIEMRQRRRGQVSLIARLRAG